MEKKEIKEMTGMKIEMATDIFEKCNVIPVAISVSETTGVEKKRLSLSRPFKLLVVWLRFFLKKSFVSIRNSFYETYEYPESRIIKKWEFDWRKGKFVLKCGDLNDRPRKN